MGSTGLVMKSVAPASMALLRRARSFSLVIIITGASLDAPPLRSRRMNSTPSSPGMR